MQVFQKKEPIDPIPEVEIKIGPDWLTQLPALHERAIAAHLAES